nr:phosphate ABC transporter permease [Raoultella sp. NCTC 9187]
MAVTFIIGNTYQLDSVSLYMPGNQYHLRAGE